MECQTYFPDPQIRGFGVPDFIKRRWTRTGALRIQVVASIMPGPYTHPGYQAGMRLAR